MDITRRRLIAAAITAPFMPALARAQAAGGSLRYGLSGYPSTLEPWINAGAAQGAVKLMTQRGLLSYDSEGKMQGELAESWSVDADGNWTFRLRPGARFHNGAEVTSADVVWSLEQVAAENSTALMRAQMQTVAAFEAPDPLTVRLVMKAPSAVVPNWLAVRELPILPAGSDPTEPIGAGPFRIVASERGTSIDLEAFADYYKPGMPRLSAIKVVAYPDENLRYAAFEAGDVDIIDFVPWQLMDSVEAGGTARLHTQDGGLQLMQFNAGSGPLSDVRVRRAIAHAIKRDEIVSAAFFGRAKALPGVPFFPGTPFYDATAAEGWAYDADRARALLAEAGMPDGFDTTILSTSSSGFEKTIAELVQQHLAQVGIRATLNLPDQPTRNTQKNRGQYEIYLGGTVPNDIDPDSLTPALSESANMVAPRTQAALQAGRAELDQAKRVEIYKELQAAVIEEVPMVSLCWRSEGYAVKNTVSGFYVPPGPLLRNTQWCMEGVSVG